MGSIVWRVQRQSYTPAGNRHSQANQMCHLGKCIPIGFSFVQRENKVLRIPHDFPLEMAPNISRCFPELDSQAGRCPSSSRSFSQNKTLSYVYDLMSTPLKCESESFAAQQGNLFDDAIANVTPDNVLPDTRRTCAVTPEE